MSKRQHTREKVPRGFEVTERYLLRYLQGKLSVAEKKRFDEMMEQDPFLKDAVEGLSTVDPTRLPGIVLQLNAALKKHLRTSRPSKKVHFFVNQRLLMWAAVLIILILILISWWYVTMTIR